MKKFAVSIRIPAFFLFTIVLFPPVAVAADHLHVFIYHRFGDNRYPTTNISLADFSAQMRYLHDHGYQVIRAGEAVTLLREKKPLPPKAVVLTVDDAYTTFKSEAMPILRRMVTLSPFSLIRIVSAARTVLTGTICGNWQKRESRSVIILPPIAPWHR